MPEASPLPLDTLLEAETPEGVLLGLRPAGPAVRSLAWLLDALFRMVLYSVLLGFLPAMGEFGVGVALIVLFVIEWFYPVLFEIYMRGATPGKAILGIRVICDDGLPVGWYGSLTRNILRTVDFLPLAYGLGLASMLATRHFQRLGDLAAGTLVVYAKNVENRGEPEAAAPVRIPARLDGEEQRAIVEYARRLPRMSASRARELADTLKPWLGADATRRHLAGMAAEITGKGK